MIGDRAAARAEEELAERLEAYQAYPPEYRLAKFSGEPKYEPEARAEMAISYLLHVWRRGGAGRSCRCRARSCSRTPPGDADFGEGPGLVAHQSPAAWAARGEQAGVREVRLAARPTTTGCSRSAAATPMFLPSDRREVAAPHGHARTPGPRDGFDATRDAARRLEERIRRLHHAAHGRGRLRDQRHGRR